MTGFIRLRGGAMVVRRGRRFPLRLAPDRPHSVSVVHIELYQSRPLDWSPSLVGQAVEAALAFTRGASQAQVDMEVRASQRGDLIDVLHSMRAGLSPGNTLPMTALASCTRARIGYHYLGTFGLNG